MNAGRELDALVAEKVMGWDMVAKLGERALIPLYSTDIAAAWQVVERMQSQKWGEWFTVAIVPQPDDCEGGKHGYDVIGIPEMMHHDEGGWFKAPRLLPTSFPDYDGVDKGIEEIVSGCETAPLAICLAALEAVGARSPA